MWDQYFGPLDLKVIFQEQTSGMNFQMVVGEYQDHLPLVSMKITMQCQNSKVSISKKRKSYGVKKYQAWTKYQKSSWNICKASSKSSLLLKDHCKLKQVLSLNHWSRWITPKFWQSTLNLKLTEFLLVMLNSVGDQRMDTFTRKPTMSFSYLLRLWICLLHILINLKC